MKQPLRRGSSINSARIRSWLQEYEGYRHQIGEGNIDRWIAQFDEDDKDMAARLLDATDFISTAQISGAFRSILDNMPGWDVNTTNRNGKWRFVAFSSSAGESGDQMIYRFRHANNMAGRMHNALFIHRSDLIRERLTKEDTVILVDDFSGTGDQACDAWESLFEELLASVGKVYLALVAATEDAIDRIHENTKMAVVSAIRLGKNENIFSAQCKYFNASEKDSVEKYGKKSNWRKPRGYGECGLLFVMSHTCPNDTIPILHATSRRWQPLFRRYD